MEGASTTLAGERAHREGVRQFAARHGLKRSTLAWWSSALRRSAGAVPAFVEVVRSPQAAATAETGSVEILVRGDLRIRVSGTFDPAVLLRLLAAFEGG